MTHQTTEEILVEYGVHLGYEGPRKELARDLERNGLTEGDLRMVMDHVRDGGTAKSAGSRISAVLSDKDRWGPLLVDLRKFHQYRLNKEARMGKRKQEPGIGLRNEDKTKGQDTTAEFFGLTAHEYEAFKWRWTVADWFHRGHDQESLVKYMEATQADVTSCVEQFPKEVSFDDALSDYAGMKGKTNASNTGPD